MLGGSWYYLIAGLGLVLAGGLMTTQRRSGALVYGVVWLFTLVWAFWEVGLDGWALVPRVVAPTVLLLLVLLTLPALRRPLIPTAAALLAFGLAGLAPPRPRPGGPDTGGCPVDAAPAPTAAPAASAAAPPLEPGRDWPVYGGSDHAMRYSPLDQITPQNVARLAKVWTFHTGDLPDAAAKGKYSPENTPLKVGTRLYACTGMNIVIAIDAATGKEDWRFDPKVSPTMRSPTARPAAASPTTPCPALPPARPAPRASSMARSTRA